MTGVVADRYFDRNVVSPPVRRKSGNDHLQRLLSRWNHFPAPSAWMVFLGEDHPVSEAHWILLNLATVNSILHLNYRFSSLPLISAGCGRGLWPRLFRGAWY